MAVFCFSGCDCNANYGRINGSRSDSPFEQLVQGRGDASPEREAAAEMRRMHMGHLDRDGAVLPETTVREGIAIQDVNEER
jgi:hypothetical protein